MSDTNEIFSSPELSRFDRLADYDDTINVCSSQSSLVNSDDNEVISRHEDIENLPSNSSITYVCESNEQISAISFDILEDLIDTDNICSSQPTIAISDDNEIMSCQNGSLKKKTNWFGMALGWLGIYLSLKEENLIYDT